MSDMHKACKRILKKIQKMEAKSSGGAELLVLRYIDDVLRAVINHEPVTIKIGDHSMFEFNLADDDSDVKVESEISGDEPMEPSVHADEDA